MRTPLKYLLVCFFLFLTLGCSNTPSGPEPDDTIQKPKLVVGIVIDQMRYNYLNRFKPGFGANGFKELMSNGYNFTNTHHNYFPTLTGPGHASIFTGATPSAHGIVGNSWFDRKRNRYLYSVEDQSVKGVGGSGWIGKRSPHNLISTTLPDELKKVSPMSKVVGISLKDRAAILPAGHLGDFAFWYDDSQGDFITSSWYTGTLPEWVQQFNKTGLVDSLCQRPWMSSMNTNQLLPPLEHDMKEPKCYQYLKYTPFGNTLVKEFALQAIEKENLGADATTDILSISFSSTDYIGHKYGPHSLKLQNTYMRLDRDLAEIITKLNKQVGKSNYLLFLTADHGVASIPGQENRSLPEGYFNSSAVINLLNNHLDNKYEEGNWIRIYSSYQVFLNRDLIASKELSLAGVQAESARFLAEFEGVASTNTASNFSAEGYATGLQAMYQRGFYFQRSGDIYIQLKPGWIERHYKPGTSHGSPYDYDTHVPLIFYGWGIPEGETHKKTSITQVAPTISSLIDIPFPSGTRSRTLNFN